MKELIRQARVLFQASNGPMTTAKWFQVLWTATKYAISAFILIICLIISMQLAGSVLNVVLIWVFIIYLASLEGGQVALVSLLQWDKSQVANSHKLTARCISNVDKSGAIEQYIMGRQFLVVIVIFLISLVAGGTSSCQDISMGVLTSLASGLCSTGLTLTFATIMIAQITS